MHSDPNSNPERFSVYYLSALISRSYIFSRINVKAQLLLYYVGWLPSAVSYCFARSPQYAIFNCSCTLSLILPKIQLREINADKRDKNPDSNRYAY